jgi:spermidine synthase
MGKIDFITGTWLIDEDESPVNGKIQAFKSFAFGTYIQVGKLTQSGGVVYDVWRTSLKRVKKEKSQTERCLILGLAGGSVAKLVRKFWGEKVEITGVDIDPVMVEMGKKHLGLDKYNVKVEIEDAYKFVNKAAKDKKSYDLICVDMYVGDQYPVKFEKDEFLKLVRKVLSRDGVAVFNRLYYDEKRSHAMRFSKKLEKHFKIVTSVFPQANIMFLCSK